jgi:AraC-like DNA-binding protein
VKINYIQPHQSLRPYIDRYWVWEDEANLPKLLPGTGCEVMFHYRNPFSLYDDRSEVQLPECHLICPRHMPSRAKPSGQVGFISVRFRSGAFRHFCRIPMNEMVDSILDLKQIWGGQGASLERGVLESSHLEERIHCIEQFFLSCLQQNEKQETWLDRAINEVYYRFDSLSLSDLSRQYAVSERHLQRKFKEATGVGPKYFQRVARFQTTLKELILNHQTEYLDTALTYGYYDQSHFLKDFKQFVDESPSQFLQKQTFESHFYCRSRQVS